MIIRKAEIKDLQELLDIYNYEVVNGVSTFDLVPKTIEEREEWFHKYNKGNHPLYVAEIEGRVAGYVSLSSYRDKEAYKHTVELSIYIGVDFRKMGVATALMTFIVDVARKNKEIHAIVSVITSGNAVSQKLHTRFGFEFCGTIKEVGLKFGEYRGVDNYILIV